MRGAVTRSSPQRGGGIEAPRAHLEQPRGAPDVAYGHRADAHDEAPAGARLHRGGRRCRARGGGSEHRPQFRADGGRRGRRTSGAVGAERAGHADVVQIVARRFYRGARVAAFGPRSLGERAPARATPSDPTLRSRHARASACAHPGAGVIDVRGTRPAGRASRWSGAEGWERREEGGPHRRDAAAPVLPRSVRPHARTGCAGARGRVTGTCPRGPPGRPTQVTTGEPSERTSRPPEASARPRLEDGDVIDGSEPVDTGRQSLAPPGVHDGGGAPPPAAVRARGRATEGAPQRARMAARRTRSTPVRLPGVEVGERTLRGPHSSVLASRKVANEVAYWRRTRRRLLTCEAASARPRAGHLGRRPPRRLRRGGACPGRTRGGRHPRGWFVRPGQFRRLRRN
jgi:hypothetical protein